MINVWTKFEHILFGKDIWIQGPVVQSWISLSLATAVDNWPQGVS